jgi:hypothetical protein
LVFEENANFVAKNWQKSHKSSIITSTPFSSFRSSGLETEQRPLRGTAFVVVCRVQTGVNSAAFKRPANDGRSRDDLHDLDHGLGCVIGDAPSSSEARFSLFPFFSGFFPVSRFFAGFFPGKPQFHRCPSCALSSHESMHVSGISATQFQAG